MKPIERRLQKLEARLPDEEPIICQVIFVDMFGNKRPGPSVTFGNFRKNTRAENSVRFKDVQSVMIGP